VKRLVLALVLGTALATSGAAGVESTTPTYKLLLHDVLINADLWGTKPRMLAAGLGFTNIIGVPGLSTDNLSKSEKLVRQAGGAWNRVSCASDATPKLSAYTSASTPQAVAIAYGSPIANADGLAVEFSWPVRPSTVAPGDFRVALSDGSKVTPLLASIYPNAEYNERSVVVLFGKFGNRDALYATKTQVVRRLQLVGPRGRVVSAVGLSAKSSTSPYAPGRTGPHLVGAKLSRMSAKGESAPKPFSGNLPNSGVTLYGSAAKFRLRVYTTGGFSPDGVRGVFPTEFPRYFRLRAGRVLITKANHTYQVAGHPLRVLGLADLGKKEPTYDDCYTEDKDNFIDIVLAGSEAAARRITSVEIPAGGFYSPFYNPGGPGNDPTAGIRYTSPGPAQRQKVMIALDNPMTVTFRR
jgi:hypothetical protein